jgi:CDP-diacylglycerol--glycerol-3-phosphate 3-phosphatidyltransferase
MLKMKFFINSLTISRIALAPFIFAFIVYFQAFGIALFLFVLTSVTDFLDGYFARKYDLTSEVGRILDPIADKVLIIFMLIAISLHLGSLSVGFMSAIIISREIWVSALREMNALNNNSEATQVTFLAKIKTTIQLFAIGGFLIAFYLNSTFIEFLCIFFLFLALIITVQTGIEYTRSSFKN